MIPCSAEIPAVSFFFFFNDTATTEIYTLSLHDALPIYGRWCCAGPPPACPTPSGPSAGPRATSNARTHRPRSEEHTSELQSRLHLVCRLLLEKKKFKKKPNRCHSNTSHEKTYMCIHSLL